jgi:hypothetical protein
VLANTENGSGICSIYAGHSKCRQAAFDLGIFRVEFDMVLEDFDSLFLVALIQIIIAGIQTCHLG